MPELIQAWGHTFIEFMAGKKVTTPGLYEKPKQELELETARESVSIDTDDLDQIDKLFEGLTDA